MHGPSSPCGQLLPPRKFSGVSQPRDLSEPVEVAGRPSWLCTDICLPAFWLEVHGLVECRHVPWVPVWVLCGAELSPGPAPVQGVSPEVSAEMGEPLPAVRQGAGVDSGVQEEVSFPNELKKRGSEPGRTARCRLLPSFPSALLGPFSPCSQPEDVAGPSRLGGLRCRSQAPRDPGPGRACCLVSQSCPTLCDFMDCSLPDASVHGILQARMLEWVAMPISRGCS